MLTDELSDVLNIVLTGEIIDDRATAERVVRSLGAVAYLHEQHPVDARYAAIPTISPVYMIPTAVSRRPRASRTQWHTPNPDRYTSQATTQPSTPNPRQPWQGPARSCHAE